MLKPLRDLLALILAFALCLGLRAAWSTWWIFDLFPGPEPVFAPANPWNLVWMGAVLLPVWLATLAAGRAWSTPDPAPALPTWLVAGPIALVISLAGFEWMRLEPVSRSLALGFTLAATPTLGLLHGSELLPKRRPAQLAKRALDVALGLPLLLLAAPLIAALATWIRAVDGGPAFFVQERLGRNGRPFRVVKLRTMRVGAESEQSELAAANRIRGPAFRMHHDPRITAPGRWLRPLGLDELPQLINVLRGEMSLVGPRPPLPAEVARYTAHQLQRLQTLPGITGLWQLTGRELEDFDAWVAVDLDYIERQSVWLDLALLARTLPWLARRLVGHERPPR